MNPPILNTSSLPSKLADSTQRVPWPTSDDRPETPPAAEPQTQAGDHRANPDAAVLVMHGGNEGNATPGLVAGDAPHPWGERLRQTVQRRPLAAMATALALGALLVRVAR